MLCLHGYSQNKDVFRQKTGSFRKPLKKYADFEYFDAPNLLEYSSLQETSIGSVNLQIDPNDTFSGEIIF